MTKIGIETIIIIRKIYGVLSMEFRIPLFLCYLEISFSANTPLLVSVISIREISWVYYFRPIQL